MSKSCIFAETFWSKTRVPSKSWNYLQVCMHYAIYGRTKGGIFKSCPRILKLQIYVRRGWGRCLKVTLQTCAPENICSCWWGDERTCQACADGEQGPPFAGAEIWNSISMDFYCHRLKINLFLRTLLLLLGCPASQSVATRIFGPFSSSAICCSWAVCSTSDELLAVGWEGLACSTGWTMGSGTPSAACLTGLSSLSDIELFLELLCSEETLSKVSISE